MKLTDILDNLLLFFCYSAIIIGVGYSAMWVYAAMITFALSFGD